MVQLYIENKIIVCALQSGFARQTYRQVGRARPTVSPLIFYTRAESRGTIFVLPRFILAAHPALLGPCENFRRLQRWTKIHVPLRPEVTRFPTAACHFLPRCWPSSSGFVLRQNISACKTTERRPAYASIRVRQERRTNNL